jgi:hypothetical protein
MQWSPVAIIAQPNYAGNAKGNTFKLFWAASHWFLPKVQYASANYSSIPSFNRNNTR